MHELAIAQSIASKVDEAAGGKRVRKVTVEIGSQSSISPEALAFCFELAALGSTAEGAALDILAVTGDALILKSMEIEEVM